MLVEEAKRILGKRTARRKEASGRGFWGRFGVTVGHFGVSFGHLWVTLGSLCVYEGYFVVTMVHFRKTFIAPTDFSDFMQLWGPLDATSGALWGYFGPLRGNFGQIDAKRHVKWL